jgi:Zn finger protein HypA/HybF involved in hydrogenase expression
MVEMQMICEECDERFKVDYDLSKEYTCPKCGSKKVAIYSPFP